MSDERGRGVPSIEQRYRSLVDHLPAVIYTVTNELHARVLFISSQSTNQWGYTPEQWIDSDLWPGVLHPDDRDEVLHGWAVAIESREPYEGEYRMRHADGHWIHVHDRADPIFAKDGSIVCWEGLARDVSAVRTAQRDAAATEQRYRALVEQLPAVVFVDRMKPKPHTVYISAEIEHLLGIPPSVFLADHEAWRRLVHPEDVAWMTEAFESAVARRERYDLEYRVVRPDGRVVWVLDTAVPIDDPENDTWQGVIHDVTDAHEADEAIAASESRYRSLVEQLPAVVYIDSDDVIPRSLYVSDNIEQLLGYPPQHHLDLGASWVDLVHPDDRKRVEEALAAVADGDGPFDLEYRYVRPDGREVWVHDHSALVRDEDGRRLYWQGVLVDITARIRVERELAQTEARARALMKNIPAVVYEMGPDDERRTISVSHQIEELLGYTREEWLEQPDIWIELLHPDDREIELAAHDQQTLTGEPWVREYRLIAADGRVVWVRDQATLVRDDAGRPVSWQGVLLDVSAQKAAEEQLRLANDELELRVLARTTELADANELMGLEIGERKRAERELRLAEERYRSLVEEIPAVVYVWDTETGPGHPAQAYTSPVIEQFVGFPVDEWNSSHYLWESRLHPHDREKVLALTLRCESTGEPFEMEYRFLHKDGRVVWVLDRATLLRRDDDGRPRLFQGVMLDITASKEGVDRAAKIEERFRELTESSPVTTYVYRIEGDPPQIHAEHMSAQLADSLGFDPEAWLADPPMWLERMHPDDRLGMERESARLRATGDAWDLRYRMIAEDGSIVWCNDRGLCVARDAAGKPLRFQGVVIDVTKETERLERAEVERASLRSIVEGIPAITWTESIDASGRSRYLYISPQAYMLFGWAAEELLEEADHFARMVHPEDLPRVLELAARANAADEFWEDSYRVIHRDGSTVWVHAMARRVTPDGAMPAIWQGVTVDVSAQHRERAAITGSDLAAT